MKLRGVIYIMLLVIGIGICKDIDAEIIKDLDFFENFDLLENDELLAEEIPSEIENESN